VIEPTLTRREDGSLLFEELGPWFVTVLGELPALLADERPEAVQERLFPLPSDDREACEEWRKYVHPDLFALLASAREVVERDLANLEPTDPADAMRGWSLTIPDDHVNAWISALNVARLHLGTAHEIDEKDMQERYALLEDDAPLPSLDKLIALEKIGLLAWMQGMIIEDINPPPEDFRGEEFRDQEGDPEAESPDQEGYPETESPDQEGDPETEFPDQEGYPDTGE
jgi:hypothetical protein